MRLEVVDPDPDKGVVAAFSMDPTPGSQVTLSGFHGSQVYPLSNQDQNLKVQFVGVENFEEAPLEEPKDEEVSSSQPGDAEVKTEDDTSSTDPTATKTTATTTKATSTKSTSS